jgi:heparin binding hemagglutinin HbhA
MSVTVETKSRRAYIDKETTAKPLYAVAGVVDLTVEKVRNVPTYARNMRVDNVAVSAAELTEAVYGDLVERGRTLVKRIRRQDETRELKARAKSTVGRAKAANTTARKNAAATRTSAKRTATTARNSANSTGSAVKGAATSARRTAKAAAKATEAGAAQVG